MSEPLSRTSHGDAPLSTAKNANLADANLGLDAQKGDVLVSRTVSINRPRRALYEFWRDFRNLPAFMENIDSVVVKDGRLSHWVVRAPGNQTVEWDARITEDAPGELIAWESVGDASVRNSGRIEFRDSSNGRGTIVSATLVYDPPAGGLGKIVAKLFQREPKIQARQDLRRFKQLMETGEVSTAQPPHAAPRA